MLDGGRWTVESGCRPLMVDHDGRMDGEQLTVDVRLRMVDGGW